MQGGPPPWRHHKGLLLRSVENRSSGVGMTLGSSDTKQQWALLAQCGEELLLDSDDDGLLWCLMMKESSRETWRQDTAYQGLSGRQDKGSSWEVC